MSLHPTFHREAILESERLLIDYQRKVVHFAEKLSRSRNPETRADAIARVQFYLGCIPRLEAQLADQRRDLESAIAERNLPAGAKEESI